MVMPARRKAGCVARWIHVWPFVLLRSKPRSLPFRPMSDPPKIDKGVERSRLFVGLWSSASRRPDCSETLEVIRRQWKVIGAVRERFACRACETNPAAGAVPSDRARPRRRRLGGDGAAGQVRQLSAAEPAGARSSRIMASLSASQSWPIAWAPARQRWRR